MALNKRGKIVWNDPEQQYIRKEGKANACITVTSAKYNPCGSCPRDRVKTDEMLDYCHYRCKL